MFSGVNNLNLSRICVNALYFSLFLSVLSSQNFIISNKMLAFEHANTTNSNIEAILQKNRTLEDLKYITENEKWEEQIRQKYKNYQVYNVQQGIKHVRIIKYINSKPIKINVVEINRKANPKIELSPTLSSNTLSSKSSIARIASKKNSIIAINGTYFKPQNGIPLGTLMIDKKILTGPIYNRVAMGISQTGFNMAQIQFLGSIKFNFKEIKIDNINQPRMLSTYVLAYTKEWGKTTPVSPKYGMQVAIKDNRVVQTSTSPIVIADNDYVLVGPIDKLRQLKKDMNVKVEIKFNPEWSEMEHIISGGPYLVKDGNVFVDMTEQKLGAIGGKNPRSAIGYTKDNNLILITVDGREQASVGMTLNELAKLMKQLGCINAMNLDGGGSSVMYVNGHIVNSPSIKGGIAISNAFTVSINETIAYDEKD